MFDSLLAAMAVFIEYPWLAAVIGVVLLWLGKWRRRRLTVGIGVLWLLYAAYETAMRRRWLCSGECDIRIDLLVIYPLLVASLAAAAVNLAARRRSGRASCLLAALLGTGAQQELPREVRRDLDAAYPGWHFALAGPWLSQLPPGARPDWVSADLDGDGRADYVAQVVAGTGHDSLQRVLAFVAGASGYRRFALDSFAAFGGSYLMRERAGTKVPDLDADPNGRARRPLAHDAVSVVFAEKGATTCQYGGSHFQCWTSGD